MHTHQTAEPFKGTWYSHVRIDLDKDTFCSVNVNLEQARLVQRGVEECQQALQWRGSD